MQNMPPDNEIIDDDFDLDDFDDDDISEEAIDASWEESTAETNKKNVSKRSFVQKNFWLIVAGIVVGGGALAMLSMSIAGSSDVAPVPSNAKSDQEILAENSDAALQDASTAEVPPMPAPMDSLSEEIQYNASQQPSETPEVLTPMPGTETGENVQHLELAQLDLDNADASAETPTQEIMDQPETAEQSTSLEAELPADPSSDLAEPPVVTPSAEELAVTENVAPAEPIVDAAVNNQEIIDNQIQTEQSVQQLSEQLAGIEAKLSTSEQELSTRISTTDQKIDALVEAIDALKVKVEKLASAPVVTPSPEAAPSSAPTPGQEKEEVTASLPPTPREIAKPKAVPVKPKVSSHPKNSASDWQLRSAQPGQAVVSLKGSNDLNTVAVGDKLSGVGRITSINAENGKWVVRGTQGFVSQ